MKIEIDMKEVEKYRNTRAYTVGQATGYERASCGASISFADFHRGNHRYCHECGDKVVDGA